METLWVVFVVVKSVLADAVVWQAVVSLVKVEVVVGS